MTHSQTSTDVLKVLLNAATQRDGHRVPFLLDSQREEIEKILTNAASSHSLPGPAPTALRPRRLIDMAPGEKFAMARYGHNEIALVCEIDNIKYDETGATVHAYVLNGAYPITIGAATQTSATNPCYYVCATTPLPAGAHDCSWQEAMAFFEDLIAPAV